MAEERHIRYRLSILDKCLRNESALYSIDDLLNECNKCLEVSGFQKVEKRTIYNDLKTLQNPPYNAQIKKWKSGHRTMYLYEDVHCSMPYLYLNEENVGIVRQTIDLLEQFKGIPQYDYVGSILRQFEIEQYVANQGNVVSFQHNPLLLGLDSFAPLLGFILNKQPLSLSYQQFGSKPQTIIVHPYHLKQYNSRWFLLALDEKKDKLSVYPLDRIVGFKAIKREFCETDVDFDEYFDDIIGVTVYENEPVQTIKLRVYYKRYSYMQTKPIHASQTIVHAESDDEYKVITIKVRWNRELEALISSYGKDMEVLEPLEIRERIKANIKNLCRMYEVEAD